MRIGRTTSAILVMAASFLLRAPAARAAGNFSIVLQPGPTLAANPLAVAAFNRAADEWSSQITSSTPITIYISADFSKTLNSDTIASTTLNSTDLDFNTVRDAMMNMAPPGAPVLPTSSQINVDTSGTFDRTQIYIQSANQKALGLLSGTATGSDGLIQFNGNFSFDYNGTTVGAGKTDFQSAAAHEIGHVLGFDSAVDDWDGNLTGYYDLMPLDLYRFNTTPTAANFTTAIRELDPRKAALTSDTVYSFAMSSGTIHGDGDGASHWKADELTGNYIGVMDPTLGTGQIDPVTDADLLAMKLIGYNATPEPTGFLVIAMLATFGLLVRRRRPATANI